jgi:prepilin-type N-terminal cleavage/methylation domain-containing protein
VRAQREYSQAGITLVEMMIVVTLIALLAAISFPAVTSAVDSLRLTSASDSIVSFLDGALNRAERRREVMEVSILKQENALVLRTVDPSYVRRLDMPEGVSIVKVLPEIPGVDDSTTPRVFLIHPGGTVPRIGVELMNRKGVHRIVAVDPISGTPDVHTPEEQAE